MAIQFITIEYHSEPDHKGKTGYFLKMAATTPPTAEEVTKFISKALEDFTKAHNEGVEFKEETNHAHPIPQKV